MSKGSENTFIGAVHRHLPHGLYHMKNHNQYNGGIADVWYSGKRDLWVEYKYIAIPKRDLTAIDLIGGKNPSLSYLQQQWLGERHDEGRSVGVIVGCKEGGVWFPSISWNCTYDAHWFRTQLRSRAELAKTITGLTSG